MFFEGNPVDNHNCELEETIGRFRIGRKLTIETVVSLLVLFAEVEKEEDLVDDEPVFAICPSIPDRIT